MTNRRTTTESLTPRFAGFVGALLLYACVIAATYFGVAHKLDIADQSTPVVPVDLVTVADTTNVAPEMKAEPMPTPPVPNMVEPAAPQPEAPKLEVAPAQVTKPVAQKTPPKKNELQAVDQLIASLSAPDGKPGQHNIPRAGQGTGLTADLKTLLANEIYPCYSPTPGAPHVEDLIVTFEIWLNPDGSISVAQPPQLGANSAAAAASNPYTQAAANEVKRAIYQCAPFKLPANRYNQWRDITFTFDPRAILGQ
jgi:hypothetical protein